MHLCTSVVIRDILDSKWVWKSQPMLDLVVQTAFKGNSTGNEERSACGSGIPHRRAGDNHQAFWNISSFRMIQLSFSLICYSLLPHWQVCSVLCTGVGILGGLIPAVGPPSWLGHCCMLAHYTSKLFARRTVKTHNIHNEKPLTLRTYCMRAPPDGQREKEGQGVSNKRDT